MHSISLEGNLPRWFAKTSSKGEPMLVVIVIAIFKMFLIFLGSPVAILAASAIAYVFDFAIGLFACVKAKRDTRCCALERPYRARGWIWIALALGIMQFPLLLVSSPYINNLSYELVPTVVGFGVLGLFFPLWIFFEQKATNRENRS